MSTRPHKRELVLNKDFKITGEIESPYKKDRLNFSCLAHQIESRIRKGCSEAEVMKAVISGRGPGLILMRYFTGKTDKPSKNQPTGKWDRGPGMTSGTSQVAKTAFPSRNKSCNCCICGLGLYRTSISCRNVTKMQRQK